MNEPKSTTIELLTDRVIKHFRRPEEFYRELEVYKRASRLRPSSWIITKRCGLPSLEWMESLYLDSPDGFDPALLASTISALHSSIIKDGMCLCHIDNQPGNLLWNGQRYYLIDFADSRLDLPETDITHLLLFWAEEFEPQRFRPLARNFLKAYRETTGMRTHLWDQEVWNQCLEQSRRRFYERRLRYGKFKPKLPESQRLANQELQISC
jgi:thiamine kinase-like enzyme